MYNIGVCVYIHTHIVRICVYIHDIILITTEYKYLYMVYICACIWNKLYYNSKYVFFN